MSWDIAIVKYSKNYVTVEDAPEEGDVPLGPVAEVRRAISAIFHGTDWSNPEWGEWVSPLGCIEFNVGDDELCTDMMLEVRAEVEVIPSIVELCRANGWQCMASTEGEFLEHSADPTARLRAWGEWNKRLAEQDGTGGPVALPLGIPAEPTSPS